MAPKDPQMLVDNVLKVASLPQIYIKVDEALNDPKCNNSILAKIVEGDTALTAKLLRIANSALYNFSSKIETVNHAITILGTQQLRELVLACSVLNMFQNIPEGLVTMESFWRHSVACGVAARNIATMRGENNIEKFFVAGLLHDIGRLILLMEAPNEMNQIFEEATAKSKILFSTEKEVLGYDHATIGGLILTKWKLAPRLCEAVQFHHKPQSSTRFPVDTAILHIADIIANGMKYGSSGESFVPNISQHAWDTLEFDDTKIHTVLSNLSIQYNDAVNFILG